MEYNKGLDFWNEEHKNCNCGSYAFNLNEWYNPGCFHGDDEDYDIIDNLEYWSNEGCVGDELADRLADFLLELIKSDFEDKITVLASEPIQEFLKANDEVIAFRVGAYEYEYGNDFDYDFHFKVFRHGGWFEKRGCEPIRPTSPDDWSGSIYYNSQTFYIIHHCENLT